MAYALFDQLYLVYAWSMSFMLVELLWWWHWGTSTQVQIYLTEQIAQAQCPHGKHAANLILQSVGCFHLENQP